MSETLIKKMVAVVGSWHADKIKAINNVLDTPVDSKIHLASDGMEPLELTGELAVGFRMGMRIAREWIEEPPFTATPTDGPSHEAGVEPEVQTVYVFTSDNGDGSASVQYTLDEDLLDRLGESDEFNMNEGYSDVLTFPADFDLKAAGFSFYAE